MGLRAAALGAILGFTKSLNNPKSDSLAMRAAVLLALSIAVSGCATLPWAVPVRVPVGECGPVLMANVTATVIGASAALERVWLYAHPAYFTQTSCIGPASPAVLAEPRDQVGRGASFYSRGNYTEAWFQFSNRLLRVAAPMPMVGNGTLALTLDEQGAPLALLWREAALPIAWHERHEGPEALAPFEMEERLPLLNVTRHFSVQVNSTRNLGFHLDLGIPWGSEGNLFIARFVAPNGTSVRDMVVRCDECGDRATVAADAVGPWVIEVTTGSDATADGAAEAFHMRLVFSYAT